MRFDNVKDKTRIRREERLQPDLHVSNRTYENPDIEILDNGHDVTNFMCELK